MEGLCQAAWSVKDGKHRSLLSHVRELLANAWVLLGV